MVVVLDSELAWLLALTALRGLVRVRALLAWLMGGVGRMGGRLGWLGAGLLPGWSDGSGNECWGRRLRSGHWLG